MPNVLEKVIVDKQTFKDQQTAIKEAISHLRPTLYLASIVKTEASRLIEITDESGVTTSFQYGFTSPTWDIITGDPSTNTDFVTWLNTNYVNVNKLGVANGVATLDANGHVPTTQIAGSVAEVYEGYYFNGEFYAETTHITPLTHNVNGIYYDKGDGYKQYRWTGSAFVAVTSTVVLNTARDDSSATAAYRADFGASNYADIVALQSGKQPLLSDSNKLSPSLIATDTSNRFVADSDISTWNAKQDALSFDNEPTDGSTNPVKSGGIKTYVDNKVVGALIFKGSVPTYDDLPTLVTTPSIATGWEYNVTATSNLYAAVVNRSVTPATLTWNLMGNSISLAGYLTKTEAGNTYIKIADKDVANGVAGLDAGGKIKADELPDFVKKQLLFGGIANKTGTQIIVTLTAQLKNKLKITDTTIEVVDSATDDLTATPKKYGYATLEGTFFDVGNEFTFATLDFKIGDLLMGLGSSWGKIDHTTDLDGKVDKVSTAQQIYATNADGGQTSIPYTSLFTGQTIMYRDASGRACVDEPTTDNEIVNYKFLGKRVTISTTAPEETTVGEKGELILYKPTGTEDKSKLYQLARITTDAASTTTYEWEEITNQLENIDGTSIIRDVNGLSVSYGGSYVVSKQFIIKNGFTTIATGDVNLIKIVSVETPELAYANEGDLIQTSFSIDDVPTEVSGTIDSMTITGDDTGDTYDGIGLLLVENIETDVNLYYFQYEVGGSVTKCLALTTGDAATASARITELNITVNNATTTDIRPEVIPYSTTYFNIELPSNKIIPLYDDTITSASGKAPKTSAVYNYVTQGFMPLSGGTFTDDVLFNKGKVIKSSADDGTGSIALYGDNAVGTGGSLIVYGMHNTSNMGGFNLRVANGNTSFYLEGSQVFDSSTSTWTPHLKWNGNEVLTSAGGSITGNLNLTGNLVSGTDACVVRADNSHESWLIGGTNYQNGSSFRASGKDSTLAGKFQCIARDGTNTTTLEGSPDGVLKWGGTEVATVTKLTDGSVTKVGTATKGGALQGIYLNAGVPTAGTQLYNKNINFNGNNSSIIRATNADIGPIFGAVNAGVSGNYLKATGGTPTWASFSLGTWTNVAFSGSSGVVFAPASGYSFSTQTGYNNKYRIDTLQRIEVSLRLTITTTASIPANNYVQLGTFNKTDNGVDVWAMATIKVGGKYYPSPFHIHNSGAVYLSNTTSSALSLSGAELQVTFFTS